MKNNLYLASSSFSRKRLLEVSKIPFSLISQNADESQCSLDQPLSEIVRQLATLKMKHIMFPQATANQEAFFLTADTLTMDESGQIYGKPVDRDDAKRMLQACRQGAIVGTAFCLQRMKYIHDSWQVMEQVVEYDRAFCIVDIPDAFLDFYLDRVPFGDVSGGITIEGFGEQFVKKVDGCYSAILGLPMYKLRESLYNLGFYNFKDKKA